MSFFQVGIQCITRHLLLLFKDTEEAQSSLLPPKQPFSFKKSLLVIGCLLLLLFGLWLLGTIMWLHRPLDPLRHPAPAQAQRRLSRQEACASTAQDWRFDCYPERRVVVTRDLCEARNCCFVPVSPKSWSAAGGPPWCFYPPDFPSYSLWSLNDTLLGVRGKLVRRVKTYYPADILLLDVDVRYETGTRLRVRVSERSVVVDGQVYKKK